MAFVKGFSLKRPFPFLAWEKSHLAGGRKIGTRVLRRVLRRGSEKAVSRRCLERPLEEYAPLRLRRAP